MAPDVMLKESITEKADIYSFGIVMWEIFTRSQAYSEFKDFRTFKQATLSGNRPKLPETWPDELQNLLLLCWDATPGNRPSFEQVVHKLEEIFAKVEQSEYEAAVNEKILDETARFFWKQHFLKSSEVSWREFERKILDWLQILLPEASKPSEGLSFNDLSLCKPEDVSVLRGILALKALFTSESGGCIVRSSEFGKVTECFGPLDCEFLDRITNILRDTAFHGFLSSNATDCRLGPAEHGTYLLRFSNNRPKSLIISQVTVDNRSRPPKKKICHIVVARSRSGGWVLDRHQFPTIPILLEKTRESYSFLHPLPCQNFFYLFQSCFETPGEVDCIGYKPENTPGVSFGRDEMEELVSEDQKELN